MAMADSAIPALVQRNVSQLEVAVSDLQKHIRFLISPESLDSLVLLSAADRAAYFLAIAKATNALFCCECTMVVQFLVVREIRAVRGFQWWVVSDLNYDACKRFALCSAVVFVL